MNKAYAGHYLKPWFFVTVFFIFLLSLQAVSAATPFNVQKRYLYVQPGQTLFSIVKVLYPEQQDKWPEIINNIVKRNPHAFRHGQAVNIKVGERIELPHINSMIQNKHVLYKGPEAVGQIITARGKTFAISPKKVNRPLLVGSEIYVGDRIFTGVDGFLRLSMIDDAQIDLRCNSEMLIEDYRLLRAGNRSVLYLIKGSLRKITGSIGKLATDVYEMRTPMATVGVRGTEYAIRVLQSHGCDGSLDVNSDGLFVKVDRGAIDLKNQKGVSQLTEGNAAHIGANNAGPNGINVG
ncbi:MAG: FecR family protein, partial [Gammaproteobacteria bacterium]|nr:FecR family protein [Gammaproteobacteria bacterium]